jgi:hypothetical protein
MIDGCNACAFGCAGRKYRAAVAPRCERCAALLLSGATASTALVHHGAAAAKPCRRRGRRGGRGPAAATIAASASKGASSADPDDDQAATKEEWAPDGDEEAGSPASGAPSLPSALNARSLPRSSLGRRPKSGETRSGYVCFVCEWRGSRPVLERQGAPVRPAVAGAGAGKRGRGADAVNPASVAPAAAPEPAPVASLGMFAALRAAMGGDGLR